LMNHAEDVNSIRKMFEGDIAKVKAEALVEKEAANKEYKIKEN
jgi:hypothetical protein